MYHPQPYTMSWGIDSRTESLSLEIFHVQIGDNGTDWWLDRHTLNLLIKLVLKRKVSIMQAEPQQFTDVLYW